MLKTVDLFVMNLLEYELPNNIKTNIILCPVMLFRRHKIWFQIHDANTMFTDMAPILGIMFLLATEG